MRRRTASRRVLSVGAAVAVALAVGSTTTAGIRAQRTSALPPAEIVFVDVGQGDGVVMKIGGAIIVSDAGEYKLANVNAALKQLGATRIDVAILSHPHEDHVKNFVNLFAQWPVKKVVMSRSTYWAGTHTNRAVMAAIKTEGLTPTYVHADQVFDWGGASWQILNPPEGRYTGGSGDAGNASIAYLLRVNGAEMLFTGDIDQTVTTGLASRLPKLDGPLEVFLVTHHGSKYASPNILLNLTRPTFTVLSVGPNSYGHPTIETISRLQAAGATIWCTNANGNITASVSTAGTLTWSTADQKAPWWSAATRTKTGVCGGR